MNGSFPHLSGLIFTPLAGGIVLALRGRKRARWHSVFAVAVMMVNLAWACWLWARFDPAAGGLQFEERHSWIPSLRVEYFLGMDGVSVFLALLAALTPVMALLATWSEERRDALYLGLILLLESGLEGAFLALNFFHWFLFWELSLVPAFFLIRLWGGPGRAAAATQFFVYAMVGSVALLLGFLALYQAAGSFDFFELARKLRAQDLAASLQSGLSLSPERAKLAGWLIFGGIFLGFAVKTPLFPFHAWLPAAYGEAPTPVTLLLTGAMSKMGVYGFVRILLPLFPDRIQAVGRLLLGLAVATILSSALAAFAQRDLKRMLAYSSMNHLGYCALGLFAAAQFTGNLSAWRLDKPAALEGVVLQMFNHGITASALFCFLAFLEKRSGGALGLDAFGGLRQRVPVCAGLMGITLFASLGLPGLNGFVSEFLIFKGSYSLATWATVLAALGLLASAVFLLTLMQKVFHGPLNQRWQTMPDLNWRERFAILPATGLMFWIGLYPQFFLEKISGAVLRMVSHL